MALKVWIPFISNNRNQGLDESSQVTAGTCTYTAGGVLGNAATFNGSSQYQRFNLVYGKQMTFACFAKFNSFNCHLMDGRDSNGGGYQPMYVTASYIQAGGAATFPNLSYNFSTGVWYHLCVVETGEKVKLYVNGEFVTQADHVGIAGSNQFTIGCRYSNANYFNGQVNDVRIYDHCLSAKEIKEISKGLVLHYKLNDANMTATTNLIQDYDTSFESIATGNTTLFTNQLNSGTIKIVSNVQGHSKCLQVHSNGGNNRCYRYFNTTAGTYVVSVDYYNQSTEYLTPLRVELNGGGYSWFGISENTLLDDYGDWKRYYLKMTITATTNVYLFFMCQNGQDAYFDNVQMEKGEYPTEYTKTTRSAGAIYDCSGYKNDGVIGGAPTMYGNTMKYDCALNLAGSSYIRAGKPAKVKDQITVACWAYMADWGTFEARLLSCTEGGGWNFEPCFPPGGGRMNFAMGTGASSNTYKSASGTTVLSTLSGWHHFAGTYDGFKTKIYIDGVLEGTNNAYTTKTPIFYSSSNGIFVGAEAGTNETTPVGQYFNNPISDVRIYGRALSADDILELFHTRASIDNNGNFYCGELKES